MHRELLSTAVAAAHAGAAVVGHYFRDEQLKVEAKGTNDFVTQADRESEAAVVAAIRRSYPGHRILGEEGGEHPGGTGDYQWLVDPLDGTTNFLQGLPIFSVSIACCKESELLAAVVLDPVGGNLFTATRGGGAFWNDRPMRASPRPGLTGAFLATGYPFRAHAALDIYLDVFREVFLQAKAIRRCGSAALDLAYTAAGVYDGFFEFRLSPWDVAAGALLIEEAGGRITDLEGGHDYLFRGNIVAGGRGVQRELQEAMAHHADEALIARLAP